LEFKRGSFARKSALAGGISFGKFFFLPDTVVTGVAPRIAKKISSGILSA
jgi:hypothetical protein